MSVTPETKPSQSHKEKKLEKGRLLSLDLFRGVTMFLLVAESTRLYSHFNNYTTEGTLAHSLAQQFQHHEWNGLYFWDLVQPFFMFIVGVAMVYSLNKRVKQSSDWSKTNRHIIQRCLILLFLGVMLHCVYSGRIVWELWNVLTQLSFTILVAYSIFHLPLKKQLYISIGLLVFTEFLYRSFPIEGFDQPFVKGENFGSWMDLLLMGKTSGGGWVAINALPTAAHTIWGVLAGKILISDKLPFDKIKILMISGLMALLIGYSMDWLGLTPIIKRISTTSFVFASGGWCLVILAACYWLVDIKGYKRLVHFFSIVGMNSIFIYMFAETIGKQWLVDFTPIFTDPVIGLLGGNEAIISLNAALGTLAIIWYLCYWLYKRSVFIKI